jgi:D-glycero-D-manno-heptose 1,7-bisphosphate phosphatase
MSPALFFDRDNTLIVNDGYLGDASQVVLIEDAAAAVAAAVDAGFVVVTVSNQSGVARGFFDETAVAAVNRRMDELLLASDPRAVIARHYHCPYLPDATVARYRRQSDLRKPAPGMLLAAARELDLDLKRSWLIGDADRDIEAGRAAGCRTVLFDPPGVVRSAAAGGTVVADYRTGSLLDAVGHVMKEMTNDQDPKPNQ